MDNETVYQSPLIDIHAKEPEPIKEWVLDKQETIAEGPFIKRKKPLTAVPEPKLEKEYSRNKFIYQGKIHNFPILKQEKKSTWTSSMPVSKHESVFNRFFSYHDYKEYYRSQKKMV